jgi:hypothetical protein
MVSQSPLRPSLSRGFGPKPGRNITNQEGPHSNGKDHWCFYCHREEPDCDRKDQIAMGKTIGTFTLIGKDQIVRRKTK